MPNRPRQFDAILPDWAALAIVACCAVLIYGLAFGIIAGSMIGWTGVAAAIVLGVAFCFAYRRPA
jgi:hypothetical protein